MARKCVTPLQQFWADVAWMLGQYWIVAKDGRLCRFKPNAIQRKCIERMAAQLRAGRPIQQLYLKARQGGVTTLIQGLINARTARHSGRRAVLVSHTDDSKGKIWRMQVTAVNHGRMRPWIRRLGEVEGPLVWSNGSIASCLTAGGRYPGHGETITELHLSEAARYGQGKSQAQRERVLETVSGIRSALAKTATSAQWVESTANGYGNWFQQEWERATCGETAFDPVFIAWFESPEYSLPREYGTIRTRRDLDDYERDLARRFGLSLEQLTWRRVTLANDFLGDERRFREQYPSTPDEAFLVSGATVFSPEHLDRLSRLTRPPVWTGDIRFVPPRGWELIERPDGPLWIWDWPYRYDRYAIGADTAECKTLDSDWDTATVRSVRSRRVVATLEGRWEEGVFAARLAALGWLYRRALLAPERNFTGVAVIGALRGKLGGEPLYPHLYRFQRVDSVTGKPRTEYGWDTTRATKHLAIEAEQEIMRAAIDEIPCERTVRQLRTFVDQGGGRCGAEIGGHDDLVTSLIISAAVLEQVGAPPRPPVEDKARRLERAIERSQADDTVAALEDD